MTKFRDAAVKAIIALRTSAKYDRENSIARVNHTDTYRMAFVNFDAEDFTAIMKFRRKSQPQTVYTKPPESVEFKSVQLGATRDSKGNLPTSYIRMVESPLTANITDHELLAIIDNPLVSTFPCHSQTVEHGVALTSACVKRRRKEENQVMSTLQTAQARRVQPGRTTYASVAASDAIKRT